MVSAAPLLPRSSLTTWTSRICRTLIDFLDLVAALRASACAGGALLGDVVAADRLVFARRLVVVGLVASVVVPSRRLGGRARASGRRSRCRRRPRTAAARPSSASARRPRSARLATGDDGIAASPAAPSAAAAPRRAAARPAAGLRLLAARLLLGLAGEGGLLGEQRLAVGLGDLVIVGMDFREGEEAVAVAAVIDEGRLQRRLDPGDLGEVDVAGELPLVQRLEVEFLDPVPVHHHDAGLFRVGGVDQHFLCHDVFRERPAGRPACGRAGVVRFGDDAAARGPTPTHSTRPVGAAGRGIGSGPARFTAVCLRRRAYAARRPFCPGRRPGGLVVARTPVAGVPGSSKTTVAVLQCRERATNTSTKRTQACRTTQHHMHDRMRNDKWFFGG